jgi:parallel beta-helix repeat protein
LVQSATGNSVGGSSPGARNVISDNGDPGVYLYQASQNTIRGNYIGTDVGGNQPLGNVYGVYVTSSNDATVGGTGAGEGNVIGDTANEGIGVDGTSNHATIQGNSIGVGTGGADVGGKAAGVRVESADGTSHTLGGTAPGAANTIGFNDGPGVQVTAHPISLSARGNSIYSNSGLGIDLGAAGVTANDALDADTGANDLQNYPVLTVATSGGGATTVRGTLGSKANQTYSVDFYSDAACDPSGNGEGRTYLGSADVTTDANGDAAIAETLSADVPVGQVVTATATDASGNTSEFSACRSVADVPAASVGDVTVPEAGGNATVPVTLSAPSADTVTVDYATTDGTAQAGSDYGAVNGTLTFAPGETTKDVTVPVTADNLDETDETLTVDLSNPDKATIADAHGDVTITDDDAAPALSIADTSVTEGTGGTSEATFTVSLSAPSGKTVKVDAVTADGSAVAPGDYTARHVALTFAPGDTSRTVTVPVTTDARDETDETFTVALAGEANATVARREAVGTIQDDDQPPAFSVSDVRVAEDTGTDVAAVFTVSLSEPSGRPTSVDFATTDGTAVAGSDYTATQTRVTFAPGETSKAVPVRVTGDSVHEPEETFGARLSAPADAVVADGEGVATVVDDDPAPVPPAQQPEQRDSSAPGFTLDGVPRRLSRADLLHDGLALILDPDEAVSFDAQLTARPRMLRGARSGDVVIARKKLPLAAGKRTTKLRVLRKLRRRFSHQRVELRLTILAVDAAGNRTRVTRPVVVR